MSFAKVILFGEHSVIYGKKAIAIPVKNIKLNVKLVDEYIEEDNNILHIKKYIKDKHNIKDNVYIKVFSDIPISSGLGSSAAVAIEIAKAFNKKYGNIDVEEIANISEKYIHKNPSGIDVKTILRGKSIIFDKINGVVDFDFKLNAYLLIFYTNIPGSTSLALDLVKNNIEENKKYIDNLGEISIKAIDSINRKDLLKIGNLMKEAQFNLSKMKLSNNKIDEYISIVDKYSLGSKITGAGLGGCVISLFDNKELMEKAINKLREKGVENIWIEDI